jgi:uncharacterized protein (TIGR02145 family)|tara:strand:+ start:1278 stop:1700 length:423 start_codon:yes stop_codon:yes gene_type:complete
MQFDDQDHLDTYGNLYNWYAVDDDKDLCMEGWHVPLNEEWTILIDYLGSESTAGGKMKESGLVHWNSPNTGATNESGFTGLPAGSLNDWGFTDIGKEVRFWSSSPSSLNGWNWRLYYDNSNVISSENSRRYGFSIRCLQD